MKVVKYVFFNIIRFYEIIVLRCAVRWVNYFCNVKKKQGLLTCFIIKIFNRELEI